MVSNDQEKISLFKLYYAWKYFVDQSILSQMNIKFNLNAVKDYILQKDPELIHKYDKYNEEERLRREQVKEVAKESSMQESLLGQLGVTER
jgi:hypothetical protein